MNKTKAVCIFAHPDDEAFGPSGTIAKFAREGEVYLICVTNGNDKTKNNKSLSEIRTRELHKSAQTLGVKEIFCLGYEDGELCNNKYHEVARSIAKIVDKIKPDTFITFELRGLSGHIDHVFCSMVTSFIFSHAPYAKTLMYFASSKKESQKMKDYFIFFPTGFNKEEVDKAVDVTKYWDLKVKAVKCHRSQNHDVKTFLGILKNLPREEYFFVSKK